MRNTPLALAAAAALVGAMQRPSDDILIVEDSHFGWVTGKARSRVRPGWSAVARSKYMPHRGAKERGKYAPNQPLHGRPPLYRAAVSDAVGEVK